MKRAFWICCGLLALLPAAALAQSDYPSRPVHIVVGFGPGSAADLTARVLAQRLSKTLGQSFVVENKPGGGSTVAAEQVARAPKDGYTLFMGSVAVIINGLLQPNLKVNFANDFAPITLATSSPNILVVHPSTGVSNVKELIALAKSKPGQLNFGSSGFGTSPHLTGELFNIMAGTKIVSVHYPGSAQALTDLLAGRIQVMFSPASTVLSHAEAGEIRALATSELTRTAAAPKLPTVSESGPARFQHQPVVRRGGAGRHAAPDRRQARGRDQRGAQERGGRQAAARRRARRQRRDAGRICRLHRQRNEKYSKRRHRRRTAQ